MISNEQLNNFNANTLYGWDLYISCKGRDDITINIKLRFKGACKAIVMCNKNEDELVTYGFAKRYCKMNVSIID